MYIHVLSYSNNNIKYFLITIFEHSSYFFVVLFFCKQQSNVYRKGAYIVCVKNLIYTQILCHECRVEFFLTTLISQKENSFYFLNFLRSNSILFKNIDENINFFDNEKYLKIIINTGIEISNKLLFNILIFITINLIASHCLKHFII